MIRTAVVVGRSRAPRRLRPRWAALLALLLLAGCQRASETEIGFAGSAASNPVAAADAPARFTTSEFIATDGAHLPLRHWLPADGVKAVILALHGFGDYGNAFEAPAQLWAARGIATYAFDQRGFGGAPGRGLWAGEGWLTLDAVTASWILRRLYPGRPLYILGESMGGAVAVLAATGAAGGAAAEPDGVILSAPALWGRATMGLLPRIALFAGVRLFPDMILTGQGLHIRASDNIPMLKALAKDPMVLKEARVDTVYGLVDLMDAALAAAPRLTAPTLFMYGAHDEVIPRPPIEDFVAHLPPDPGHVRRLAYYPEGYHMLLRDLDGATVAGDVASWILDRGARLPSRADAAESAQPWPPSPDSNG